MIYGPRKPNFYNIKNKQVHMITDKASNTTQRLLGLNIKININKISKTNNNIDRLFPIGNIFHLFCEGFDGLTKRVNGEWIPF